MSLTLRPARDADGPGIVALVATSYARYENSYLDPIGEEPGLMTPTQSFDRFWVLEHDSGWIVGSIALTYHADASELKKVYLIPKFWGQGWGSKLYETAAAAFTGARVFAWSDTRFHTGHKFYRHKGFRQLPETRFLNDHSETQEFCFEKDLV